MPVLVSPPRPLAVAAILALLGGCAGTQAVDTSTDAFLRSALDAYGVIAVAPSRPVAGAPRRALPPAGPPLTRQQVCAGRSGPLPQYIDARTRQPIDCGPAALSV